MCATCWNNIYINIHCFSIIMIFGSYILKEKATIQPWHDKMKSIFFSSVVHLLFGWLRPHLVLFRWLRPAIGIIYHAKGKIFIYPNRWITSWNQVKILCAYHLINAWYKMIANDSSLMFNVPSKNKKQTKRKYFFCQKVFRFNDTWLLGSWLLFHFVSTINVMFSLRIDGDFWWF